MSPFIFCCGMIRSGSTVLYQVVSEICELKGIGKRAGYYEPPGNKPKAPESGLAIYKVPWLCQFERDQMKQGAIAFYSYRCPNEALESAYRAFAIPEGDRWLWKALTESSRREMIQRPPVGAQYWFRFERIRDDLRGVIADVARWLPGRELSVTETDSLSEELSLAKQKVRPKVEPYDPHTLISPKHFN